MKTGIILVIIVFMTTSSSECGNKTRGTRYQGKLEIKGICSNYTIRLLSGNMDTALLESNWKDETTNQTYKNVFALGNPCDFPSSINQGETFYFTIDTAKPKDCIVCMAYYPTPVKKIKIIVQPAK